MGLYTKSRMLSILAERSPLRRMSTAGLTRPVAGNCQAPGQAAKKCTDGNSYVRSGSKT